jgi:hypothetical protein
MTLSEKLYKTFLRDAEGASNIGKNGLPEQAF